MTSVINICFHGIGDPDPGLDAEAAAYFVSKDLYLGVLDSVAQREDVAISFDDGYASDVEIALPALVERGLTAAFFPLAGSLGQPGHVDVAGVKALISSGMTVGSHGMRHRSWRGMDTAAAEEELGTARSLLSQAAGQDIADAACPFGSYDRQVLSRLRRYGYKHVFTSDRRRAQPGAWLQPRYSIVRDDTVRSVREGILAPRPLRERVRGVAAAKVKALR
jgi:peptidoglycan/xylan/chitin deacetylase (PgdA/CDA1 family)